MDARKIGYWVSTGLGCAILAFGATNELLHTSRVMEALALLGMPAYVATIMGTWKSLALLAVLAPGLPRLQEWAYAGLFFDFTGAILSYAAVGAGASHFAPPIVVFGLFATSWALRPASRALGGASRVSEPPAQIASVEATA